MSNPKNETSYPEFTGIEIPDNVADAKQEVVLHEVDPLEAPLIALVGRPNVGKSRMFNRMTGTRHAIVEDMPGVTRDRQYGYGTWDGRAYQVVDTGGFDPDSEEPVLIEMRRQAQIAMDEADIVFFLVDSRSGIMPADREIAQMLRQTRKTVIVIANKVDGESQVHNMNEFFELGVDILLPLSAEHGLGYGDVMDSIVEFLPKRKPRSEDDPTIRIAVVGKPNAGKSTLVNRMIGEDRLLTSDIPGTTRDAVNTRLVREDTEYLFIDTAGIRRKRSINEQVERSSVVQAFKALDRADIAVHVIDATKGVTAQDKRIAGLAHDKGCGLILVLNKWDLIKHKSTNTARDHAIKLRDQLKFASYAPIVTMSALTGQRAHRIFPLIDGVFESYKARVSTSQVNKFVERAVAHRSPPQRSTRKLRLYYGTQVATRPPTFMIVVNNPDMVHFSYDRYLNNGLRESFGFEGAPIKIFYRKRGEKKPDER